MTDRGPKDYHYEGEMLLIFERSLWSEGVFTKRAPRWCWWLEKFSKLSFHFHLCLTEQLASSWKKGKWGHVTLLLIILSSELIQNLHHRRPCKIWTLSTTFHTTPPAHIGLGWSFHYRVSGLVFPVARVPFLSFSCAWLSSSHHLEIYLPKVLSLTTQGAKL